MDDRIKKSVMNVKEMRGMFQCSNHYAVMTRIRLQDKWVRGMRNRGLKNRREGAGYEEYKMQAMRSIRDW